MFPEHIQLVLQDLGYLALVIIAPCTIFNTVQSLTTGIMLRNHIEVDNMRFERVNKDVGRHDSEINDLKTERLSTMAEAFKHLVK